MKICKSLIYTIIIFLTACSSQFSMLLMQTEFVPSNPGELQSQTLNGSITQDWHFTVNGGYARERLYIQQTESVSLSVEYEIPEYDTPRAGFRILGTDNYNLSPDSPLRCAINLFSTNEWIFECKEQGTEIYKTLWRGYLPAGRHTIGFDGSFTEHQIWHVYFDGESIASGVNKLCPDGVGLDKCNATRVYFGLDGAAQPIQTSMQFYKFVYLPSLPAPSPLLGYYIAANGNDSNLGTFEQPWKTFSKAASVVQAGDTVYVRGGTYVEKAYLFKSGTEAAPIRFLAYPGETPVIDGQGTLGADYGVLLKLVGDYIEASGFEVKNSAAMCVALTGQHDKVSFINAHHCYNNGILITGNYGIVEDSEVWQVALNNEGGHSGAWSSGLTAARRPDGAIIRRNYVHDVWGECVSTYEATNTTIQDNTIHDCFSVSLYLSDTIGSSATGNTIYKTVDSPVQNGSQLGLFMSDEKCLPCSGDITVTDNYVSGTRYNLYIGYSVSNSVTRSNITITGNTFENAYETGMRANASANNISPKPAVYGNTIIQTNGMPAVLDYSNGVVGENTIITDTVPSIVTPTPTITTTPTPTATPVPSLNCVQITWEKGLNLREGPTLYNLGSGGYLNKGTEFLPLQIDENSEGVFAKFANDWWVAMDIDGKDYAKFVECSQ